MKRLEKVAVGGIFCALLLGAQFALSFVGGVEIVTPLLLSYALFFGALSGMAVATCFSLIRCVIFGFFPSVVILYLIYYNLFALLFGLIGHRMRKVGWRQILIITPTAVLMTALFTLLDDIISPLFYGMTGDAVYAYFAASLPFILTQCITSAISVPLLVPPLHLLYTKIMRK